MGVISPSIIIMLWHILRHIWSPNLNVNIWLHYRHLDLGSQIKFAVLYRLEYLPVPPQEEPCHKTCRGVPENTMKIEFCNGINYSVNLYSNILGCWPLTWWFPDASPLLHQGRLSFGLFLTRSRERKRERERFRFMILWLWVSSIFIL